MNEFELEFMDDWVETNYSGDLIELDPEQQENALTLSQQGYPKSREWSVYLQILALHGFETWLQTRQPTLGINTSDSLVFNPIYANVLDAVCHLNVGGFNICLLPILGMATDDILVPRAVVDLPEYAHHFYVIVSLDETQKVAAIRGFLNYNQLTRFCQDIQPDEDWHYPLDIERFNPETNDFLLNLNCLEIEGVSLPAILERNVSQPNIQKELEPALLQVKNRPMWNVLSWQQARVVFTTPNLLNLLYQSVNNKPAISTQLLKHSLTDLVQPAINGFQWTQSQLDALAEDIGWVLLPQPTINPQPAMRLMRPGEVHPDQKLDDILRKVSQGTPPVPSNAGRAYLDIVLGNYRLRLYVVIWASTAQAESWNLILIMGTYPGDEPPYGVKLKISEQTTPLMEEVLEADNAYLHVHIESHFDEQLTVSLSAPNGETQVLPPFQYQPEVA